MGIRRKGRDVHGILLLNKPLELSSNEALTKVKRIFDAKKAGHGGSLDPLATGMLPIGFGDATKFLQFLLEADKQYLVKGVLGVRTTTGDAEGEIVATKPVNVSEEELQQTLQRFEGEISQIPSMYSALKYQGKPLYYYARQGIEIPREPRNISIKVLKLIEFEKNSFSILVTCSKGTYIRTLIDDIGQLLGCGAYVGSLHRTYVEPYQQETMFTLDDLSGDQEPLTESNLDSLLLSPDSALVKWPRVKLISSVAYYIQQGQPVMVPHAPTQGWVRLFSEEDTFIGVGEMLGDGRVAPRRLVAQRSVAK